MIVAGVALVGLTALGALLPSDDESDGAEETPAAVETTTTAPTTTTNEATTEPADEPRCLKVPAELVRGIADGLTTRGTGTLRDAWAVKSDDPEGYLISADIQAPGLEGEGDVATWSRSGGDLNSGLIFAVDSVAREFSEWGAAINEGSPAADLRDAFRESDAYEESRDCVEDDQ